MRPAELFGADNFNRDGHDLSPNFGHCDGSEGQKDVASGCAGWFGLDAHMTHHPMGVPLYWQHKHLDGDFMEFDYVIVGGGSAGCVLASRLSEDPAVQVALIEAGPPDTSALIHCPAGIALMARTEIVTQGLNTVPQPGLNGRIGFQPRGRTLG